MVSVISSIHFHCAYKPSCPGFSPQQVICDVCGLEPKQSPPCPYQSLTSPSLCQDTLRECTREDKHCLSYLPVISPVYFVTFVLIAQFVLVNVVVAVLMKHLEESNKEAKEDAEMDAEIELEMSRGATTSATGGSRGGAVALESRAPYRSQETTKSESVVQVKHQALVRVYTKHLLLLRSGWGGEGSHRSLLSDHQAKRQHGRKAAFQSAPTAETSPPPPHLE